MILENELTYSGVRASAPTITYPNSDYKEIDLSVFTDILSKKSRKNRRKGIKLLLPLNKTRNKQSIKHYKITSLMTLIWTFVFHHSQASIS